MLDVVGKQVKPSLHSVVSAVIGQQTLFVGMTMLFAIQKVSFGLPTSSPIRMLVGSII